MEQLTTGFIHKVTVLEGKNIRHRGKNTFIKLKLIVNGKRTKTFKTGLGGRYSNPKWGATFYLRWPVGAILEISCLVNAKTRKQRIGSCILAEPPKISLQWTKQKWYDLEDRNDNLVGMICMKFGKEKMDSQSPHHKSEKKVTFSPVVERFLFKETTRKKRRKRNSAHKQSDPDPAESELKNIDVHLPPESTLVGTEDLLEVDKSLENVCI